MIASLRGVLVEKGVDGVIVDVGGVGYLVHVPTRALDELPPDGDVASLFVHTSVREDAIVLYGFASRADLRIFERLIVVSGIGPRLALAALSALTAADLRALIMASDVAALSRVPGIGKKTASRIVLELSERIEAVDTGPPSPSTPASRSTVRELRLALENLGFVPRQVDGVIDRLRERIESQVPIEALLKEALALLRSP